MSVECKYAVLVTAVGSEGLEYSFTLYANTKARAECLFQLVQLATRTCTKIVVEGVDIQPLRVSPFFQL